MPLVHSESKCKTILTYENDFDLHDNETAYRTPFHMKGVALRLVLKQRHKRTRKWPIHLTKAYCMILSKASTWSAVNFKKMHDFNEL